MTSQSVAQLALPAVTALILLLSYGSQYLFRFIGPSPLGPREASFFNASVICILICYIRACFTDPGRVPSGWKPDGGSSTSIDHKAPERRQRWCRKCEAFKPPRAHHCKTCGRYIPLSFTHLFVLLLSWWPVDAYRRWTTIVPGLLTAFRTVPFLIFSAFFSTLLLQ